MVLLLLTGHLTPIGKLLVELEIDLAADGQLVDAGDEAAPLPFEDRTTVGVWSDTLSTVAGMGFDRT